MKKEYIILGALILGLSLYLGLKKNDQTHYTLPEIKKVDTTQVDRLTVQKGDEKIEFKKTGDGWTVGDEHFPADKPAVDDMLTVIQNLKLSTLVSEKDDRIRYELDKENALDVKAFKGDTLLMTFKIGKPAPSYNHTFVMIENNDAIFHAVNSFRSDFDKTMDEFRDKAVLKFDKDSIQKITLEKAGKTLTLTCPEPADDQKEETKEGAKAVWQANDGSTPDKEAIESLLDTLSSLVCDTYPGGKNADPADKTPDCKIILENNEKMVLNLYVDGEKTSGTSSMNDYLFELQSYTANNIAENTDKLLGIEKEAENMEQQPGPPLPAPENE